MMESQCEYSMYFPAAPISSLSDPTEYASLPLRNHVYLGETVQFLLVLRFRDTYGRHESSGCIPWKDLVGSLSALATVCVAGEQQQIPSEHYLDPQSCSSEDDWDKQLGNRPRSKVHQEKNSSWTFRHCKLLFTHSSVARDWRQSEREPVKSALVLEDQVIFCLAVSLDKLPANTLKAKIIVTVWKQQDSVEVREHGYLTLMQLRSPKHTFKQDLNTFKAQVSTILKVLPPPGVQCQQITVCGKHMTVLKVLNCSSMDEVCVRDVKILPNYNSSYLPVMPDGSVVIVDNVCHKSAEVTMASFRRIDGRSSQLPSMLGALEEHNFLFQLQLQNKSEEDSSEGLEVRLVAVLNWCVTALPLSRYICSCYSLPSIRLDRPKLIMTASCPSAVKPLEHFWVKYTLLNNLQDFLAVRLIWNNEALIEAEPEPGVGAVVCQSTLNNLGHFRKGSSVSFHVAFQILRTGLFEMSKHIKVKVQFTASVSTPTHLLDPPLSCRTILTGQAQSFFLQQPSLPQHFRSGSVMEQQTIAPLAGTLTDRVLSSLDKITKRECKVFVLKTHTR